MQNIMHANIDKTEYLPPTIENIASLDNLYMAWNRLAKSITYSDVWYDEYAFYKFECMLDKNIRDIHIELLDGTYRLDPIRPIPFPKGGKDDEEKLKVRQAFWISMKDQLVWVAICNILGPHIETKMPGWSTGNRLYVPMWKENGEESSKWEYGSFLNSYPFIYRKWKQGWPRYRKVLTASIKKMAIGKSKEDRPDILDDTDETEINENIGLPQWLGIRYLSDNYFKGDDFQHRLYWGGIDLKTFYPTIQTDILVNDLIKFASVTQEESKILIHTMFEYEVDKSGYTEQELADMGFKETGSIGLPTGLIVGGWLANVYLLEIDNEIERRLKKNREIIHFRYVDDHTFVAKTFEGLIDWMHEYWLLLQKRELKINFGKIQPILPKPYSSIFVKIIEQGKDGINNEEIRKIIEENDFQSANDVLSRIGEICSIDPIYPSPLMTLTLQKVSQISHLSLNLLSKNENELVFHDLKTLITVDLPDAEIKKETRISFASTMLSRMLLSNTLDLDRIRDLRAAYIKSCETEKQSIKQKLDYLRTSNLSNDEKNAQITELRKILDSIDDCLRIAFDRLSNVPEKNVQQTFPTIEWQSLVEISKCIGTSKKESNRRANKIFYLLRRALDETPDKVNIWIRTMEFCIRHTPTHIQELLIHLKTMSGTHLHRLGALFIHRQLYSLCSVRFIKSVWKKYECQKENRDFDEVENQFISEILKLRDLDDTYFFNHGTARLFKLARSFYNLIINGEATDFEAYLNEEESNDANFSLIYLINLAEHKISPNLVYEILLSILPSDIPKDSFSDLLMVKIIDLCHNTGEAELKKMAHLINSSDSLLLKSVYECALNHCTMSGNDNEWISIRDFLRSKSWQTGKFAKSEYVSVKILYDILSHITETDEIIKCLKTNHFSTSNLFLRRAEILECDWHDIISDKKKFLIRYDSNNENDLLKLLNHAPEMRPEEYECRIIFELGTIFYHLLCGRQIDVWQRLFHETSYSWRARIDKLSATGRISTGSKKILIGCLMPYVWETRRINGTISFRNQAVAIGNINTLRKRIETLKEILRRNIVLKSIDVNNITDSEESEYTNKAAYNVIEFKIIDVN